MTTDLQQAKRLYDSDRLNPQRTMDEAMFSAMAYQIALLERLVELAELPYKQAERMAEHMYKKKLRPKPSVIQENQ